MLEGTGVNPFGTVANDLNTYTLVVQWGVRELQKVW